MSTDHYVSIHQSPEAAAAHAALMNAISELPEDTPCMEVGPDLFFPEGDRQGSYDWHAEKLATKICFNCPVLGMCADYGIRYEQIGVWGGMAARERRLARKLAGITIE